MDYRISHDSAIEHVLRNWFAGVTRTDATTSMQLQLQLTQKRFFYAPSWAEPYNRRACLFDKLGKFDDAIADFSEAIRLDPQWARYNNRGIAYSHKGDDERALADFDEAVRRDGKYAKAYDD